VSVVIARDPTMVGNVTFGRPERAGPIGEEEVSALRMLAPHFRRAVTISRLLDTQTHAAATLAAALEMASVAIVLVDGDLRVVHANAAASRMLAAGDPIRTHAGCLELPASEAMKALRAAVTASAGEALELGGRGLGIPVRRNGGSPCVAHVLPMNHSRLQQNLPRAAAAIFIASNVSGPRVPADALALLYELTPAEVRVFELIVEGSAPTGVARVLGIAPSTVRTHLLRVFEKTGCRRQSELIRLANALSLRW
jgi:DNA-binding CsgD family transcriptional regulator